MPSGQASASKAVRQEMLSSKSTAPPCATSEAVEGRREQTELNEPAGGAGEPAVRGDGARAGARNPSAQVPHRLVKLEQTDSSSENEGRRGA